MSYVPVLVTVISPSTFVSEDAFVMLVLCNTWTFFDEPPLTLTTSDAKLVTSYVPFSVLVSLPLTNSLADTDTEVPVLVEPVI